MLSCILLLGCVDLVADSTCRCCTRRGRACFAACYPLPLACFPAPYPPSPRSQSALPGGTCYPCPGGEDHLKRRSSSPPVPPLLGCRHCSRESLSVGFTSNLRLPRGRVSQCRQGSAPRRVALTQVEPVPRPIQPRGCKGRSPLHKKTISLPLPRRGRGRGDRGQNQS